MSNQINVLSKIMENRPHATEQTDTARSATEAGSGGPARRNSSPSSDTVSLTDGAARLKRLEQTLTSVPVVDQARVAAIKQLVSTGHYEVDAERVAQKLLNFEQALGGKVRL